MVCKLNSGSNIQEQLTQENNYSMHGDHFILMRAQKTIDSYVTHIIKVAALLGYGEPQVLEVI